jgi:hypothetical protein
MADNLVNAEGILVFHGAAREELALEWRASVPTSLSIALSFNQASRLVQTRRIGLGNWRRALGTRHLRSAVWPLTVFTFGPENAKNFLPACMRMLVIRVSHVVGQQGCEGVSEIQR